MSRALSQEMVWFAAFYTKSSTMFLTAWAARSVTMASATLEATSQRRVSLAVFSTMKLNAILLDIVFQTNLESVYSIMVVPIVFGCIVENASWQRALQTVILAYHWERWKLLVLNTYLTLWHFWIVTIAYLSCSDLSVYSLFEHCEILCVSKIMHDRMFPDLFRSSLMQKIFDC